MEDVARSRDRWLTVLAILMGLIAVSNFWKPIAQRMAPESDVGFVFFGTRLHGAANAVMGPVFGVILAAYAYGAWTRQRWVVPLAVAYALYVIANLILFTWMTPADQLSPMLGMLAYAAVAIGVSGGGAYYLWSRRETLR
jgi:drug/metabolite transporter (DMT)-like permease